MENRESAPLFAGTNPWALVPAGLKVYLSGMKSSCAYKLYTVVNHFAVVDLSNVQQNRLSAVADSREPRIQSLWNQKIAKMAIS